MSALEKAARAVVDSAVPFGENTPMAGNWTCRGIDALRAALEAEEGWETTCRDWETIRRIIAIDPTYGCFAQTKGYEYHIQRRPLRKDGDKTPPYSMGDDYG